MGELALRRHVDRKTVTAAGNVTVSLPREKFVEAIVLDISGTVVTTGLIAADIRSFAPSEFVSRIEVQANGDTLYSKSLAGALCQNRVDYGHSVQSCVATSDVLCTFRAAAILDVGGLPGAMKYAGDYLLPAWRLDNFNVILTVEAPAQGTIFYVSGEPTSVVSFSATIDVSVIEQAPSKERSDQLSLAVYQPEYIVDIAAANTRLLQAVNTSGLLDGVAVLAIGGAAAATRYPIDTIVNSMSLEYGGLSYLHLVKRGAIQAELAIRGGQEYADLQAGLIGFRFSRDGLMSQMLDTQGMKDLNLAFDVTHPSTYDRLLIWPRYIR